MFYGFKLCPFRNCCKIVGLVAVGSAQNARHASYMIFRRVEKTKRESLLRNVKLYYQTNMGMFV